MAKQQAKQQEKQEHDLVRRIGLRLNTRMVQTEFHSGDTIEVAVKVKEGEKERIQNFRGTVIKVQGRGTSRTFTVRKISDGVGVERTFPFASPSVDSVKLIARGSVRRTKLYYLRSLKGKKARIDFELVSTEATVKPAKAKVADSAETPKN